MDPLARAQQISWYHSLELAPGHRTTGMFDLEPYVPKYGLPARMEGLRVLEIGTWDGFWAFEMESRGADVTALDVESEADQDWPPRRRPVAFDTQPREAGFAIAHEVRSSDVERVVCNVYDALPANLGTFDLVFCGSVLIHVRDQLLALERIANLVRPGGMFISAEAYDRQANLVPMALSRLQADVNPSIVFWRPNIRAWRRMLRVAGFDRVRRHSRFDMRSPQGFSVPHVVHHAFR